MASYRELFRAPGVLRVVFSQLLARFPAGMLSLAALIHVEHVHGSYAAAGLVIAALAVGQAVAGPLTSRIFGRFGMRRVIGTTLTVSGFATAALAIPDLSVPLYAVTAFIAGISTPPIQPAARSIYPSLVPASGRTALFAFDASIQEVIWIMGPVLTTFVALGVNTSLGILLSAVFLAGGGLWFLSAPQIRTAVPAAPTGRFGSVLRSPALRLASGIGFLICACTAMLEAAIVAVFGHGGALAGVVLAVFCVGSLAAGLALGHHAIGRFSLARRMGVVAVGLALAAVSLDFWWILATVFVAGLGVAPVIAAMTTMTSAGVPAADVAEAFGWSTTAQLVGVAIGSAVAGIVIDGPGPQAALAWAAGLAAAGVLLALLVRRGQPGAPAAGSSVGPQTGMLARIG
ncbi:MFS transporter [Zafaria sp. Z1313]|uniref:MFS transporter n=1 Tax=unclassified Zafaria TaxID=2828765 RepID=UPI002E75DFBD|nr:MFS transporter [Zafaria sp. J156]MEE1619786.1 MFS transporter [Zafaria sp. J156]